MWDTPCLLHTPTECRFDRVVLQARFRLKARAAFLALAAGPRCWFKSAFGLGRLREVPRAGSLLDRILRTDAPLWLERNDALSSDQPDPLMWMGGPECGWTPEFEAFAGFPVRDSTGCTLGVLGVVNRVARPWSREDRRVLGELAGELEKALDGDCRAPHHVRFLRGLSRFAPAIAVDPLTGTWTRRAGLAQLRIERRRALCRSAALSLLLVDVDGMGECNRTHGRSWGDRYLQDLAAYLTCAMSPRACVARFAGDEFLVLAPETGRDEIEGKARQIRAVIHGMAVPIGDTIAFASVSVGAAGGLVHERLEPGDMLAAVRDSLTMVRCLGWSRFSTRSWPA